MINARVQVPTPVNEPVLSYAPGSPERAELNTHLVEVAGRQIEIPLIIGGAEVRTGDMGQCVMPHDHQHVLATFHKGNADSVQQAVAAAAAARPEWAAMPWEARASVFLKAAELLAGKYPADHQRGDDAEPEQDGLSGRDRRGLRVDRFPALQRLVHAPDIRGATRQRAGDMGLRRVPAARGLRPGDHAVQLHLDRRQPADQPGDDGQHGHLEAGFDRRALCLPADGDAQGGGDCPTASSTSCRAAEGRSASRR